MTISEDVFRKFPVSIVEDLQHQATLLDPDEHQSHALVSTAEFEPMTKDIVWKKPGFLFGDNTGMNEAEMSEDASRWVRLMGSQHYFLPPRARQYSITSLCRCALPHRAEWALAHRAFGAVTGELMRGDAVPKSQRGLEGLRRGSLCTDLLGGWYSRLARIFANIFSSGNEVNYPAKPRFPGWIDVNDKD